MIPSSKFQSSSPLVMEQGPFFRIDSRAMLTSLSYSWVDLILWCRVVFPSTVICGVNGKKLGVKKDAFVILIRHPLFKVWTPGQCIRLVLDARFVNDPELKARQK